MSKPVKLHIFTSGTHEDMSSRQVTISNENIDQAIANYSTAKFRCPLIVGHDTGGASDGAIADSELAHGVASYFERVGDRVYAVFQDKIVPKFREWVEQGRLHSISASFYLPNSPHNPNPGEFSFRHIAALGKNPPAVKGLEPIQLAACFGEGEVAGDYASFMVPFGMGTRYALAGVLRKLRDWLITKDSLQTAEDILPHEVIDALARDDGESLWGELDMCHKRIYELQTDVDDLKVKCNYLCQHIKTEHYYGDHAMSYKEALTAMAQPAFAGNLARLQSISGVSEVDFGEIVKGRSPHTTEIQALAEALNLSEGDFIAQLKSDQQLENESLRQQVVELQVAKRQESIGRFIDARPHQLTPALTNPIPINFSEGGEEVKDKLDMVSFATSLNEKQWAYFSALLDRLPDQGDMTISSFNAPILPVADEADGDVQPLNYTEVARKARDLVATKRAQGIRMDEAEAVDQVIQSYGVAQ